MERTPIIDEACLPALLERFYGRVREDAEIGPVFNAVVEDWTEHLERLAAFWSSVTGTSARSPPGSSTSAASRTSRAVAVIPSAPL